MATEAVEARGNTVARAAASAAERHPERIAIRHRQDGERRELSFAEVGPPTPRRSAGGVAGNSDARMVVCEDASQADKIRQVRGRLQRLE
jgi:hypothetical protein